MNGARVVLTGGGGFIGSRLLVTLVSAGANVTLVGATLGRSAATARLVAEGVVRFVLYEPDSRRSPALREAMRSAEALVLLGYTLPRSRDPEARKLEEIALNVTPNLQLLQLGGDALAHVVFASSVSVYGSPERGAVRETDPGRPETPYAIAKLACEEALREIATHRALAMTVLRSATVYGPGETVPRAIPNFIRAALGGRTLLVDGDGLDEHDYAYVEDVADAMCEALRRRANGTYNVGTGIGTTTLEIARLVRDLVGSDAPVSHRPARPGRTGRTRMVCATERARAELGFSARWHLPDGLEREIAWFRDEVPQRAREGATP